MKVDISFDFAKVFNIDKDVTVVKGQKFALITDSDVRVLFFSNNDAVLAFTESDTATEVEATNNGTSTLLITDGAFNKLKEIDFTVVDAITEPVKALNVTSENLPK